MINYIWTLGTIINFVLLFIGIIAVKGVKYTRRPDVPKAKGYEVKTIKLPVIAWAFLIISSFAVPILSGMLNYWILSTYMLDLHDDPYYYCEKSKLRLKMDKVVHYVNIIISTPFTWLFYKI